MDWYNGLPDSGALILAGGVGCGKTHISRAIYDLFGHWRSSFYDEVELAKAIQHTYDDNTMSEDFYIRQVLFRRELFFLDDLGTYRAKDLRWIHNVYRRVFNDYLVVQKKPILITTNLPLMSERGPSIEQRIGQRSFSRLCEAMTVPGAYIDWFDVPDKRIEKFVTINN